MVDIQHISVWTTKVKITQPPPQPTTNRPTGNGKNDLTAI